MIFTYEGEVSLMATDSGYLPSAIQLDGCPHDFDRLLEEAVLGPCDVHDGVEVRREGSLGCLRIEVRNV